MITLSGFHCTCTISSADGRFQNNTIWKNKCRSSWILIKHSISFVHLCNVNRRQWHVIEWAWLTLISICFLYNGMDRRSACCMNTWHQNNENTKAPDSPKHLQWSFHFLVLLLILMLLIMWCCCWHSFSTNWWCCCCCDY